MQLYHINSKSDRIDAVHRKKKSLTRLSVRCGDNECYVLRTIDSYTLKKININYLAIGKVSEDNLSMSHFSPLLFFP